MKSKDIFMKAGALLLLLALLLCGCGAKPLPGVYSVYIQPAELTEEESAIAKLLGADTDQHLFDVVLDGTAKTVRVNTYELVDGTWALLTGGGGMALKEGAKEGRMAFGFEDLRGEYREALQFGSDFTAVSYGSPEEAAAGEGLGRTTAFLSERTEIVYEREIPLAIQISTAKNDVLSYNPSYFFQPEEYEKLDYEHVYALTVTFSQEPLS